MFSISSFLETSLFSDQVKYGRCLKTLVHTVRVDLEELGTVIEQSHRLVHSSVFSSVGLNGRNSAILKRGSQGGRTEPDQEHSNTTIAERM